jgi:EAL domain-containing protein (putative c-di-GMP-specific phosphodiesterase class I)
MKLKTFQKTLKKITVHIGQIQYAPSLILSYAQGERQVLESARLGIKELLKNNGNFICATGFAHQKYEKAHKNIETLSMIRRAISDHRIICYFQPIIDNATRSIKKYESLVRLIDEEGKVLSPFFFLDVAKRGNYYAQITDMVLDYAFKALKYTDMDISVNLSIIDIENETTRDKLFDLIEKNAQNADRVVFELLEDENVKEFELIADFITEVKQAGVKIAIDDFGSGYSNFERLLQYQPDILKIDGSLVKNIEHDAFSRSVVKTIVAFAKEQAIQTVAEFVENETIYTILKEIGVDYSQGYHFGKPQPLDVQ